MSFSLNVEVNLTKLKVKLGSSLENLKFYTWNIELEQEKYLN